MAIPKRITLDPTNLQTEHTVNDQGVKFSTSTILEVLYFHLLAKKRQTFCHIHQAYVNEQIQISITDGIFPITLVDKNKKKYPIIVSLQKPVIARRRKNGFRFDVLDQPVGTGAFKYVYGIHSTYFFGHKGLEKKPNKQRLVLQVQPWRFAQLESRINKEVPYLDSKDFFISKDMGLQAVRKIDGISYEDFRKKLDGQKKSLNIDQRLLITINLLRALKKLHDLDIIHRDIKFDNFMVDESLNTTIIDFGLSVKRGLSTKAEIKIFCGSPVWSAPEFWLRNRNNLLDKKSDIYSLYSALWEIWGGTNKKLQRTLNRRITPLEILQAIKAGKDHLYFVDLFKNIEAELTAEEKTQIKSVLQLDQPSFAIKANRKPLDKAIEIFENIRLNRLARLQPFVAQAHKNACEAVTNLQLIAENRTNNPLQDINTCIETALVSLDDNLEAIKEFIRTLNIKSLQGLTTKSAIVEKTKIITNDFDTNMEKLLNLSQKIEEKIFLSKIIPSKQIRKEIQDIFTDVEILFTKESTCKIALDDLEKWNGTFNKKFDAFCNRFENIKIQLENANDSSTDRFRSYATLLENLKPDENDSQLMRHVKHAIQQYFNDTFPYSKFDRAASARRLKDMQDILKILIDNKNLNDQDIINKIKLRLNTIKTGLPGFFGRSLLRKNIQIALQQFNSAQANPPNNSSHLPGPPSP